MSAELSTFIVTALWALPIAIALILMVAYYRPPSMEEIRRADEVARKQ
jgi:hypothetical protein